MDDHRRDDDLQDETTPHPTSLMRAECDLGIGCGWTTLGRTKRRSPSGIPPRWRRFAAATAAADFASPNMVWGGDSRDLLRMHRGWTGVGIRHARPSPLGSHLLAFVLWNQSPIPDVCGRVTDRPPGLSDA